LRVGDESLVAVVQVGRMQRWPDKQKNGRGKQDRGMFGHDVGLPGTVAVRILVDPQRKAGLVLRIVVQ
jgi:hypothetical protein